MNSAQEILEVKKAVIKQLFALRKKIFHDISIYLKEDFSITEIMVLMVLKNKNYQVLELAKEIGLPASTLTGIIDRLVKKGLVERYRSEEDRRVVIIGVGEGFKEKKEYFREKVNLYAKSLGDELPNDWWVMMHSELEKLTKVLEKRS